MDSTFDEHLCYISRNTKLRIISTLRNTTLKITYLSTRTSNETTIKIHKGITLICFCRVNFKNEKIKIELDNNCKLINFRDNEIYTTIQIKGNCWFNTCSESNKVYHKVVEYKWMANTTSSCKCMMNKELNVVCNILDQIRLFGDNEDIFRTYLKAILFKTHYKRWYKNDFCSRNERKLVWDHATKKISSDLEYTIRLLYPEKNNHSLKFSRNFIIYYSPHLVKYKLDNDPFVREYVD